MFGPIVFLNQTLQKRTERRILLYKIVMDIVCVEGSKFSSWHFGLAKRKKSSHIIGPTKTCSLDLSELLPTRDQIAPKSCLIPIKHVNSILQPPLQVLLIFLSPKQVGLPPSQHQASFLWQISYKDLSPFPHAQADP